MTHGQNKIPAHPGLRQLELLSLPAGAGSPPGAQSCHFPGTWDWDGDSGYVLKMQFLRAWKQMSSQVLCLSVFFPIRKERSTGEGAVSSRCIYSRCCSAVSLTSALCQNLLVMQDCTGVETN